MSNITVTINYKGEAFTIEGDFTPFQHGRYCGPPDACFPDEPAEFDIESVYYDGCDISLVVVHCFSEDSLSEIKAMCVEQANEQIRSMVEDARVDAYLRKREERDCW